MVGSTALFITMPIVVIVCLGLFIGLPFLGDRQANRRLTRSPAPPAPGGGAVPYQRRGNDDSVTRHAARAGPETAASSRPDR